MQNNNKSFTAELDDKSIGIFKKCVDSSILENAKHVVMHIKNNMLKMYSTPLSRDFQVVTTINSEFFTR